MAELLVWGSTAVPANAQRYQRGDVVVIKPDGWAWGASELRTINAGGVFWLVKIPGTSVADCQSYVDIVNTVVDPALLIPPTMAKRRARGINVSSLTPAVINQLNAGPLTRTKAQVDTLLVNR